MGIGSEQVVFHVTIALAVNTVPACHAIGILCIRRQIGETGIMKFMGPDMLQRITSVVPWVILFFGKMNIAAPYRFVVHRDITRDRAHHRMGFATV